MNAYHKMIKNLDKKVSKYYKKLDKKVGNSVPNETVFRLLGNNNFNCKNKRILDIGIGNGDNLLEFRRREHCEIFGIDIKKKVLKIFINQNNLNPKNFFSCDLNYNFPKIKKKMDLILCKDTIYYVEQNRQLVLFDEVYKNLKKGGFFLMQYIQCQFKQKPKKKEFSFNLNNKTEFEKLNKYFQIKNPIPFLENKHIMKLIKYKKFQLINNIFDISTHTKNKKIVLTVNRFLLFKK
tara:strand:- start:680 stop:1387 length:708 start_codon:yes stop_codon:yes gene_type:complete